MAFPDLPWRLEGEGLMFIINFLIPVDELSNIVPTPLQVVPILPGRTIDAIIFNKFGPGSEIE